MPPVIRSWLILALVVAALLGAAKIWVNQAGAPTPSTGLPSVSATTTPIKTGEFALTATAYRTARGPEIKWYFPPSVLHNSPSMSLGPSYYIELDVRNASSIDSSIDTSGGAIYFVGSTGQVLNILLIKPSQSNTLRIDTDGYTNMLQPASGSTNPTLFIQFKKQQQRGVPQRARTAVFSSVLPPLSELKESIPVSLLLREGNLIPDVAAVRPAVTESILNAFGDTPAFYREQDNQTSLYFYYPNRVPMVTVEQQRPASSGDMFRDLGKVGISRDTVPRILTQTPAAQPLNK